MMKLITIMKMTMMTIMIKTKLMMIDNNDDDNVNDSD